MVVTVFLNHRLIVTYTVSGIFKLEKIVKELEQAAVENQDQKDQEDFSGNRKADAGRIAYVEDEE